jgi:hypothetical protein
MGAFGRDIALAEHNARMQFFEPPDRQIGDFLAKFNLPNHLFCCLRGPFPPLSTRATLFHKTGSRTSEFFLLTLTLTANVFRGA